MITYKGVTIIPDPRPDLAYDSTEWTMLLTLAHALDSMVGGSLHGFRCGGLRLHRGARGYVLRPDLDPSTSIWETREDYLRDRDEWLTPHKDVIVRMLRSLTQVMAKEAAA